MDRFQRGKIYAIRSADSDMVYIGSTVSTLTRRIYEHRANFKAYQAGKGHYVTSYKLLDLEGHYIELVENYPCADRNELNRREGQIMRETAGCINKIIAGRTPAEYCQDNKEAIAIRDNRKFNCECGGKYTHGNRAVHSKSQRHQAFINA